jgi:diacylglycerol kinase
MNNNKPFSITDRIKSFGFAIEGVITFFKTQHNALIHIVAATVVIVLGFVLKANCNEWCWLIIAIAMVIITEMLNTAIEFLCDVVSPEIHPQIKKVKDVSAAAVLIASIAAVAIGLIVFLPKICYV